MTAVYERYPIPHEIDVICCKCKNMAQFEFAEVAEIHKKDISYFQNSDVLEYQQFMDSYGRKWHAAIWYKGIGAYNIDAIKDLPEDYSPEDWHHPRYFRTFSSLPWGTINCKHCSYCQKHNLEWPKDAWWQINFKGNILWGFNRESTLDILNFIESKHRVEKIFKWGYMLRHIPKLFLQAKSRNNIARKLRKILES